MDFHPMYLSVSIFISSLFYPFLSSRRLMDIGLCPPEDIFHYHAATSLIHRPISLLINDHAAQQYSTAGINKQDTRGRTFVHYQANGWEKMTIKGVK